MSQLWGSSPLQVWGLTKAGERSSYIYRLWGRSGGSCHISFLECPVTDCPILCTSIVVIFGVAVETFSALMPRYYWSSNYWMGPSHYRVTISGQDTMGQCPRNPGLFPLTLVAIRMTRFIHKKYLKWEIKLNKNFIKMCLITENCPLVVIFQF